MASAWDSGWNPKAPAAAAQPRQVYRPPGALQHAALSTQVNTKAVNTIAVNNDILLDWSRLGYTSARHVDLPDGELPPGFTRHEVLGSSNSVVRRVEVLGTFLAMKTYQAKDKKRQTEVLAEINILRRLRHHHVIEYVGSMTLNNPAIPGCPTLSALFWPVAPCGFDRFFQEIDTLAQAVCDGELNRDDMADSIRDPTLGSAASLLRRIVYPGAENNKRNSRIDMILRGAIRRLFASFGCLAEALFYVHRQSVSHKDIKPSNILIYPNLTTYQSTEHNPQGEAVKDGLRLTDFDGAKDLSQCLISTAEDNWVTYSYASPETHANGKSGRAADIFSMGCVFFEMLALATIYPHLSDQSGPGPVQYFSQGELRMERGLKYLALHAKEATLAPLVAKIGESLPTRSPTQRAGTYDRLQGIIQSMLAFDPRSRPSADMVVLRLSAADVLREACPGGKDRALSTYPLFGKCCTRFALGVTESQQLLPSNERLSVDKADGDATTPRPGTPSLASDKDQPSPSPLTARRDNSKVDDDDEQHEDQRSEADETPPAFTVPPVAHGEYTIQWNKAGQRIDPPTVPYNRAAFDRIKKLELCQYRYLMGVCQSVDTCKFKHNYKLSDRDLDNLRALKRQQVCLYGTKCTNSACFAGHNCSNMRLGTMEKDRTKTSSCFYGGPRDEGGQCWFSKEMHDMDITVAYGS